MNSLSFYKKQADLAVNGPQVPENFRRPDADRFFEAQEFTVSDYFHRLWRHKWMVVSSIVVIAGAVALVSFKMTPTYQGIARVGIYPQNAGALNLGDSSDRNNNNEDSDYSMILDTQSKILEGDAIAGEVINQLHLGQNQAFTGKHPASGARSDARLLDLFHRDMTIVKVPHTRLIEIRFLSSDPHLAAQVPNAVAASYIEHNFRTRYDSTMQATQWLTRELADLQVKVVSSEQQLVSYEKQHDLVGGDDKDNPTLTKLDDLNKDLTEAQADRIRTQADYQLLQSSSADSIGALENGDPVLQTLRTRKADLSAQYAQLTSELGSAHPKVIEASNALKDVDSAIQAEVHRIGRRIENQYRSARQRESMLTQALGEQKHEAALQNQDSIGYNNLKREADTNRQLYEQLLQKLKQAGVEAGLRSSNIRVEEAARVPEAPARPNIPVNIAWGLVAGTFVGLGLAFMAETFDDRVRTTREAEEFSSLPALGTIPVKDKITSGGRAWQILPKSGIASNAPVEIISHALPGSPMTESYRRLRSLILLSGAEKAPQVILFASAAPGEGKTTTAINQAIVLAQTGSRVLLIDGDLRNPTVHRPLEMDGAAGLSDVLLRRKSFEQVITQSPQQANLFVMPAGRIPHHPAELLGGKGMKELLRVCRRCFDYIVIDTPPILCVTDALSLAAQVDAVLLVVRAAQTSKEQMLQTRYLLTRARAPLLGVVVNGVEAANSNSYYYTMDRKHGRNGIV